MSAATDYPATDTAGGVELLAEDYWRMCDELDTLRAQANQTPRQARDASRNRPAIPLAEVHHDRQQVTFAVTLGWRRPWAMDHCEVGVISGEMRRALVDHFKGYEQLSRLIAVETWEPNEERWIGGNVRSIDLHDNGKRVKQ